VRKRKRSHKRRMPDMTSLTSRDRLRIFRWHRRRPEKKRKKERKIKLSLSMNNFT
jgi:hypothetical protein